MNWTANLTTEEIKKADYYDDTCLLFRVIDFVSTARWNLLCHPIFSWYAWRTSTLKLRTLSLRRKNRILEYKYKASV